jgi:ATP-dependent Clp protease ATP-binding subunit ClpA
VITRELEQTLKNAEQEAVARKHEFVTLEHLLYALTSENTSAQIIMACGGNLNQLRAELDKFLRESIEKIKGFLKASPQLTVAFERVLDRAVTQAQSAGKSTVDGGNVLAAMFGERHSHAVFFLEKQGMRKMDLLNHVLHGMSKSASSPASGPACDMKAGAGFG